MRRMFALVRAVPPIVESMLLLTLVSVGFFLVGVVRNGEWMYWYLLWNLFLAWVPFLLCLLWLKVVDSHGMSAWRSLLLWLIWLGFLPNSFYPITDFIHLYDVPRVDVLFDVAMIASIVTTSLALGFLSVYVVHQRLLMRFTVQRAGVLIGSVLLVCSFAIYLGRNLRWNTWDILFSPAALLFDVSSRIIRPQDYPDTYITTFTFFVLLGALYVVVRRLASVISVKKL